ncbi:MAG TPA: alpha/beta hydrolase [Roseimicrobium sp.]|nr:alpha/beta hydrolase [Roseimicrobium sp.]
MSFTRSIRFTAWWLVVAVLLVVGAGCSTYPKSHVALQRDIEYARIGSHSLKLDLYTPRVVTKPMPVLVWIHGGAWKSGSKDFCPLAFLAKDGMAVVSIEYRLSTEAQFPAPLHDCKGAIRWLRANASRLQIDPDHVGVFGASAGGHYAALLGTTGEMLSMEGDVGGNTGQSSRVQAVVAFYPPTDLDRLVVKPEWRVSPVSDVARLIGGPIVDNLDKVARANPINYVTPGSAPFFLLHGDRDKLVPVEQSRLLYAALQKAGVPATLRIIPGKGHAITAPPAVAKEILEFLHQYLGIQVVGE